MQRLLEYAPYVSPQTLTGGAAAVTAGLAGAYYLATRPAPFQPPCSLDQQSVEVEGEDGARMSSLRKDAKIFTISCDGVTTSYEAFQRGRREAKGTGRCLGWRTSLPKGPYQWISYDQVYERTVHFGSGLLELGLLPGQDTFVGIFAKNRPEWVIADMACQAFSMVTVPLYETLGPQAISFILTQANLQTVVCDNEGKVSALLDSAEGRSVLKRIIVMDDISDSLKEKAGSLGIDVVTFSSVEDTGKSKPHDPVPPKPEDLFTVCYTSGTTGLPKGVMLTHSNVICEIIAIMQQLETVECLTPDDVHVSFLPLAHAMERLVTLCCCMHGVQIGYYGGDIKTLMDDIKELRPTLFPCVPRLLNRIYDKVIAGVQGSYVKRTLLETALRSKIAEVKRGICRRDSIWDTLLFSNIQDLLGGRVKFVMTGAAPLSEAVITFLRAALGCHVLEGYGQTESGAAITFTIPGDNSVGHVGAPATVNLVKLVDIPEMGYYAKNNQGEVCAKGPNVMKGYYKSPEKTAEALDKDGWLHTGDVGEWLPNGALKIIDRKKNLFKLAQGEYVAPEKVENIYTSCAVVAQAFVHGDSLKSSCVGIIVPDPEVLPDWAKSKLGKGGSMEELCKSKVVQDAILQEITTLGKKNGLFSFEQVKAICLQAEPFSVENGLLTATFKSKRNELRAAFQPQIQEMYTKLA